MSDSSSWWKTIPAGGTANLRMPAAPTELATKLKATRWYTYVYIAVVFLLAWLVVHRIVYK
jgi:hypothetical protein